MIAAIYARKSTDQSGVSEHEKSVARQIEGARAYAESRGWTVAESHIYVDDGISGSEFANRPGFLRVMNSLKPKPPFNVLVMSEESRLGREQIEVSYALKQLVQAGVRVFFYMEDRERKLDSPTDKIMMSLTAFADELEREKGRQRTKDAMRRKARAGHVTGGRVFGYDNAEVLGPDGKRSHVKREINETEAEVVREIFRLCKQGYGQTRIAKALNERGAPTPRAQQDRPRAWAPSSLRGVLYRDLYRGLIVWNKSKKRDSWGRRNQRPRLEAEWMKIDAPELQIVPDELWDAAHARLAATRRTYLRQQNGRLWGRPPDGIASKYLLIGIGRCGHCGAGLEVRSRASGKRRLYYYSCSSYYRRGKAICPNKYEIPMKTADAIVIETLLDEILTPDRLATVAQRAVELARTEQKTSPDLRSQIERELSETQSKIDSFTKAIGVGGDIPSLVEALKTQEAQRGTLKQRLETLDAPPVVFDSELEQRLTESIDQWREILGRQVPQARQIVNKLLAEKITFSPEDRNGQRGFRFKATGTVEKLVEGVVPGSLQAVVSPRGLEPVLRQHLGRNRGR